MSTSLPYREYDVYFMISASTGDVAALQFSVDYSRAFGGFYGNGPSVQCTALPAGSVPTKDDDDSGRLDLGLTGLEDLPLPSALFHCGFFIESTQPPELHEFLIFNVVAADQDQQPVTVDLCVSLTDDPKEAACGYCGDGIVNADSEECEDGNTADDDGCVRCQTARCGDGYVQTGVETCDDANLENLDECRNDCGQTRCGDGVVDAAAGEQCDDGNTADGDGCSGRHCRHQQLCGDADGDGTRTATDALIVLKTATGVSVLCPDYACDVDDNGSVTATDSLRVLRRSVQQPISMHCGLPTSVIFYLAEGDGASAVRYSTPYDLAFAGHDLECTSFLPNGSLRYAHRKRAIVGNVCADPAVSSPLLLGSCHGTLRHSDIQEADLPVLTLPEGYVVRGVPY